MCVCVGVQYVCVPLMELHLCVDTNHSPCHQLKQNMEEILIKALSNPGGVCVFMCAGGHECISNCVRGYCDDYSLNEEEENRPL